MLTLLAWARYAERPSAARYGLAALALAAGLLSKPTLVTTPFVLWLLDAWPLGRLAGVSGAAALARRAARLLLEKLPLLALSAATSAVAYAVQSGVGATKPGARLPLALRLMNALDACRIYLAQSVWPSGLAVFYPHPLGGLGFARVAAAALLLALLTTLALVCVRKRPYLLVGWLWFLGMLVPVSGLVQVGGQAHADRYMYLPLIGLSLAVAFLLGDAARARPALRMPIAVAAALALAALALVSTQQAESFRDPIALHTRNVAVTENNFVAHQRLANALQRAGRLAEAEAEFGRALALQPSRADLRLGLADVLARSGRVEDAIAQYRLAIAADPRAARAHANLALALAGVGQLQAARFHFERALELTPPGPQGAPGRARLLAALDALAAKRAAGGRADEAARLRALAAELERSAPQVE
jgi:tetratricopeptide (TPR) repeat protein